MKSPRTSVAWPGEEDAGAGLVFLTFLLAEHLAGVHVLHPALRELGREVSHHSHCGLRGKETQETSEHAMAGISWPYAPHLRPAIGRAFSEGCSK